MNSFYNDAGARIRRIRELNRYTRDELAELANISPKFLYEIETGQKGFSADTLYRLAKALSVSCEYILSGETSDDCNEDVLNALKLFNSSQIRTVSKVLNLMYELHAVN